jgi:hypothetical protein
MISDEVKHQLSIANIGVHDIPSSITAVGANLCRYIHALPCHAHYRTHLIGIASGYAADGLRIPPSYLTSLLSCSKSAISKSQKAPMNELEIGHASHRRQGIPVIESDAIKAWIISQCPVLSGQPTPTPYQFGSNHQLYCEYKASIGRILYDMRRSMCSDANTNISYAMKVIIINEWNDREHDHHRPEASSDHWCYQIGLDNKCIDNIYAMMHHRHKAYVSSLSSSSSLSLSSSSSSNSSSSNRSDYITIQNEGGVDWLIKDVYKTRSYESFMKIRNTMLIHHHPSDMPSFRCHYCWHHMHTQEDTTQEEINKGEKHKALIRVQRYTYQQLGDTTLDALNINYFLACQDFTTINTQPNIGASQAEQEKGSIKALTISIKHRGEWWHYIWLITNTRYKELTPYAIVSWCWRQLLSETMNNKASPIYGVNQCDIWSDGSAGQFKNQYMIAWYGMTRHWWYTCNNNGSINKSSIRAHYFAPYHGHNICDATAHIKQVIRQLVEKHEQQCKLNLPTASINVIDCEQVQAALQSRLTHCRVTIIDHIPAAQLAQRYEWMPKGSKQCFMFTYSPNINDELIVHGYANSNQHTPIQSWSSHLIVKPNEIWSTTTTPPKRVDVIVGDDIDDALSSSISISSSLTTHQQHKRPRNTIQRSSTPTTTAATTTSNNESKREQRTSGTGTPRRFLNVMGVRPCASSSSRVHTSLSSSSSSAAAAAAVAAAAAATPASSISYVQSREEAAKASATFQQRLTMMMAGM